jgi:hypothetical protein
MNCPLQTTAIDEGSMVKLTTVLAHASGQVDRVGLTGLRALSDVAKRHRMGMALNYSRRYSRFFPSSVSQAKMISTRPTPRDRGNDRRSGGSVCERSQLKCRARSPKRRCWMRRRSHHCDVHRFANYVIWWKNAGIDPPAAALQVWSKTRVAPSPVLQPEGTTGRGIKAHGDHSAWLGPAINEKNRGCQPR